MSETSLTGKPTAVRTSNIVTRPAEGTEAAPMAARVAVMLQFHQCPNPGNSWNLRNLPIGTLFPLGGSCRKGFRKFRGSERRMIVDFDKSVYLTVMTCPNDRSRPFICAMKIAATASYSAVPSMFSEEVGFSGLEIIHLLTLWHLQATRSE